MITDSRIAHRCVEANARLLAFWIGFGEAVGRFSPNTKCIVCRGKGILTYWDGVYLYDHCHACKGTGKL